MRALRTLENNANTMISKMHHFNDLKIARCILFKQRIGADVLTNID